MLSFWEEPVSQEEKAPWQGPIIGVLVLMCLTAGMQVIGAEAYYQTLVKGVVLIIAVVTDVLVKEKIDD